MLTEQQIDDLAWQKTDGLLPAIVQNSYSGKVLMLGYMNKDALKKTLETEQVTFFSRSKQRLWTKGETSGNILKLKDISADCDQDALLILAEPYGPTCHTGSESCWADAQDPAITFIDQLNQLLNQRKDADPEKSYTAYLFGRGTKRIAQKVGEEGVEVALAAAAGDKEELANESADLLYHLLVLLEAQQMSLADVISVLQERHNK